jgi:hypothetical protein
VTVECDPKTGRCTAPSVVAGIQQWKTDHEKKTEEQDGQISVLFKKIDKIYWLFLTILLSIVGGAFGIITTLAKFSAELALLKGGHP